jgi:hypothetical protein
MSGPRRLIGDPGHGGIVQAHRRDRFGHPARLVDVRQARLSGLDLAEVTAPGAPVAEPIRVYFEDEHEQWREEAADDLGGGLFVLPLAPDRLHKDNVSGDRTDQGALIVVA